MDVFCFFTSHFLLIPDDIFGLCIIKRAIMQNSCIIALFQSRNTVEKRIFWQAAARYFLYAQNMCATSFYAFHLIRDKILSVSPHPGESNVYLSLTAVAHYHKNKAFSSLVTIFWQE